MNQLLFVVIRMEVQGVFSPELNVALVYKCNSVQGTITCRNYLNILFLVLLSLYSNSATATRKKDIQLTLSDR